ncbi:MAG: EFR1 family ferrodoxin [Methylobacteriaceae bacterium]|jgi:ferredoxin|nr:EFR1 family ferrodoxin [Methylobacteriaceae bacterium]
MNVPRRLVIFYFSGTGNSKRVALWLAEFARAKGVPAIIHSMINTNPATVDLSGALIVFISPVHGFNFPPITLNFISRFPPGANDVLLMNTRGGFKVGNHVTPGLTGVAFMFAHLRLRLKGYHVVGAVPFDMPSNWFILHPVPAPEKVQFIHNRNRERLAQYAGKLFSGRPLFIARRDIIQDIFIAPVALAYYCIGRFWLAKQFYASSGCDNCGICISRCPVDAIRDDGGRPYWTLNCESCMKCMNGCPEQAIDIGHGFIITLTLLALPVAGLLSAFLPGGGDSGLMNTLVVAAVTLALLTGAYRLRHRLLKHPWYVKLAEWTSLTHYRFWGKRMAKPPTSGKSNDNN